MKTTAIIGGSGFIGSHITKRFLAEGHHVKVSATDISDTGKYNHLKDLPGAKNLEILPLKVENKKQLKEFLRDCETVVHGGTPFQLDFQDAKTELLDPTINGTDNFLESVSQTTGIKKVVIISSVAAFNTNFPLPPEGKGEYDSIDENMPRFTSEESHPYARAKFMANQQVQKFIETKRDLSFEICTVSPVMVMGRSLSHREDSTSTAMQFLFKNHIAPNEFVQALYDNDTPLAIVDVEDVADAVYRAATTTGLHGKDYLLTGETYPVSDVRTMLNGQKPQNQAKTVYQNQLAKSELGVQFKPVEKTLKSYRNLAEAIER